MQRLRQLALKAPGFLDVCSTTATIRQQLIEKISHGNFRALMLAEVDALTKQLGYTQASIPFLCIGEYVPACLEYVVVRSQFRRYLLQLGIGL